MASAIAFSDANAGFQAGIINGPVSAAFHLPPERRETPPPPSIVIPFARDSDFVERGTILDQVDRICAAPDARAALVGLGGVGKSQLAIEYAYRTHEQSPNSWVFWVHASNAARFEQSFRDIADRAKIYGRQDPQANIFKLVHDWLYDCKQRWLLVLDNVDDARFLLNAQATDSKTVSRPLREYLPHCERGSILVTTRSKEAALKLAEQRNILSVELMDEAQALALFKNKLELQEGDSDVAKLAVALEYMPLAIVQAAAYISQRAPRYSVKRYLDEFEKSERKRTGLLNYDEAHLRRDWEAKNSIIVTWEISFEYIQQTRPSAADLLSLMSFFDPQGIPEYVLWNMSTYQSHEQDQRMSTDRDDTDHGDSNEDDSTSEFSFCDSFDDDVLCLRDYALISANMDESTFEMHSLVQLAVRSWLMVNERLDWWKEQYIHCLYMDFPIGDFHNWAKCQTLFPHVKSAVAQRPNGQESLKEWSSLLTKAAQYALRKGNVADAENMSRKAMKANKSVFGSESLEFISGMVILSQVCGHRNGWDDAEKLLVQVMETCKKVFGTDSQHTLSSMANLASIYKSQGRWEKAEELEQQVVDRRKIVLGRDHVDTLASMTSLAWTYNKQGRFKEARKLDMQVATTRNKMLDSKHALSTMITDVFTIAEG